MRDPPVDCSPFVFVPPLASLNTPGPLTAADHTKEPKGVLLSASFSSRNKYPWLLVLSIVILSILILSSELPVNRNEKPIRQ